MANERADVTTSVLEYASPPPGFNMTKPRHMGFLAQAASLFLSGLGQFISGRPRRGWIWFAVLTICVSASLFCIAIPKLLPMALVLVPIGMVLRLWMWIDAFVCGHKVDAPILGKPLIKYPIGLVLMGIAAFASPDMLAALLFRAKVVEAFILPSASMIPALVPGDRFVVHKRLTLKRWDIIAFNSPQTGQKQCARVVGLPGEKIEIVNGIVQINSQPQLAPSGMGLYQLPAYPIQPIGGAGAPITLGADEYFVLGDNGAVAMDSRFWQKAAPGHQLGALPAESIIGVATWTYWPPSHWKKLN